MKNPYFIVGLLAALFISAGPVRAAESADKKNSPEHWVEEGRRRFEQKRYKKALSLLNTALEKSPQCAEAYYWRGRSYEAMDKLMEAANEYRAALLAREAYGEAQEALARVQALLGPTEPT